MLHREAPVEVSDVSVGDIRMTPEAPFRRPRLLSILQSRRSSSLLDAVSKSQENIAIAEQLAEVLGADLAASRPICDSGWLPIDRQIGRADRR